MGFPVGYTEVFLPNLFVYAFLLLGIVRTRILWLLRTVGLSDFLANEPEAATTTRIPYRSSVPAVLIQEILPVLKLEELAGLPETCAVCLYEFQEAEDVRWLSNCRHVFHRGCLDRWMEQDRDTCPLCRTPFVPDYLRDEFQRRLWAVSGIPDFYGD